MQPTTGNILNVTLLEPRKKHPTIFDRFDELSAGETLTIHNDHDPKPVYYQLLGERGNIFKWAYQEQGPEWWKVDITKNIAGANEETLGQIVAKDVHKAEVFKKYGLDFCCGGKMTLKEACAEKGLDIKTIEQELLQGTATLASRPVPYAKWSLGFLSDYIVNTHHSYVRKTLPEIRSYALKVMNVHGDQHPELARIHQLVEDIHNELSAHLVKEEQVVFPYIKAVADAVDKKAPLQDAVFGTVQNPINMMEMEHELVGKNLAEIRTLTDDYTLPTDACASYSLLYSLLNEFEEDLHLHINLENNILFEKAIAMEKQLKN